jgi:hypothetical protein
LRNFSFSRVRSAFLRASLASRDAPKLEHPAFCRQCEPDEADEAVVFGLAEEPHQLCHLAHPAGQVRHQGGR